MFELFILLVLGHLVADYVFQTDSIALGKNNTLDPAKFGVNWYYWMASHAATPSLFVYVLTVNIWACLFEFVSHFIIDYLKCNKYYGLHIDQLLHIICKGIIVILFI